MAAMLAITIMANSGASIANAMMKIPVLGTIAEIVTFREYKDSTNDMTADVKIPEVSVKNEDGSVNQETTDAVSYTHLDVYKRQAFPSAVNQNNVDTGIQAVLQNRVFGGYSQSLKMGQKDLTGHIPAQLGNQIYFFPEAGQRAGLVGGVTAGSHGDAFGRI